MYADVVTLAAEIGPREATSAAFGAAADLVDSRFRQFGYTVERQDIPTPAGVSWGVAVPAGTSTNVIATPAQLRPGEPYVIVGAHLDTVPQAPGAEDNASGIAVLLELARLASSRPTEVPVVLVAFGSEEPRARPNPQHTYHHFGSRAYVAAMSDVERSSLVGMVALDRVGVGDVVPVTSAGIGPAALRDALLDAAKQAGVPARQAEPNTGSDHLSFEMAGLTAARVGGTSYAGYHSAADVVAVVDRAQLARSAVLVWEFLQHVDG